ncbi:YwpF-like family protein [Salisediminibacterium selenitireducens]|uniref:YwpF-like protein n=1 Tax=Bacillus selenitireducens (strain ATCC 700615 / DSM 15326 / MLS10) TaxID=439292 RepID=D6XUA4_BACIE|nr:YwpF-like family protein [Salisediminibacterium selenitireducens]ADH99390.1 hypothetical protein Bsel_1886 [[Bacillus] selenitireducens MLS10]
MKTFKLCSMTMLMDEESTARQEMKTKEIPLVDGLIINKEEVGKAWLVEAVLEEEWRPFFEAYLRDRESFMMEVTITRRTNDPATLVCDVKGINELDQHMSLHLDGTLVVKQDDLSDQLLRNLIDEGYEGDELYEEFRARKKNRGKAIQGILSNAYQEVRDQQNSD